MPLTYRQTPLDPPRRSLAGRVVRWLFAMLLVLVVGVAATLVAVFQFEQATWGPLLETLVERSTGRTLKIEGELDARAGRLISVHADRISLSNVDWGSREALLVLNGAQVSVDLWRLLDGLLVIDEVSIANGELSFEQDAQGRSNWAMGIGETDDKPATERLAAIPLLIERAELLDLNITVASPRLTRPLTIRLDSITQQAGERNQLNAAVSGTVDDRPIRLQASIEPFTQLLAARAVNFRIQADVDALSVRAEGEIDDLLEPKQPSARLTATAPDVAQIAAMFALPENLTGELQLDASMIPVGDRHGIDVDGFVGPFTLDVQAHFRELGALDDSALELTARGPDLAAAAKLAGLTGLPAQPFDIQTRLGISEGRLRIDEMRVDTGDNHLTVSGVMNQFPQLENSNVQLELRGANYLAFAELLGVAGMKLEPAPYSLRGNLAYGARDEQTFSARATLGDIKGEFRGHLTEYPGFVGSRLDYFVTGPDSTVILRALGRPALIEGSYAMKGSIDRTDTGFSIEDAVLSLADNELAVSGTLGNEPLRGHTKLSVRYMGPDLAKIAGIAGYTGFMPEGHGDINVEARAQAQRIHLDELTARLGRSRLQASGRIGVSADMAGSQMDVAVQGEDVADVLPPALQQYVDAQQAFDVVGKLETRAGKLAIDAITAKVGEVRLDASGIVALQQPLTDATLSFALHGPDLGGVVPQQLRQEYPFPRTAFSVSGDVALTQDGLALDGVRAAVGQDRLAVSGMVPLARTTDALRLAVAAEGPNLAALVPPDLDHLGIEAAPYKVSGEISLGNDILSIKGLKASMARADISGNLGVSVEDPRAFGQFDLRGGGPSLDALIPTIPRYRPPALAFNVQARGGWDAGRVTVEETRLEIGRMSVDAAGQIDLPPNMTATRLVFSARSDTLTDVGEIAGVELPQAPFSVTASLSGNADSLVLPELDLRVGESDLRGSLTIKMAEKPELEFVLDSRLLDLAKLMPVAEEAAADDPPPEPPSGGRVIPDIPVPTEPLHSVNFAARVTVGEIRLPRNTFSKVDIDAILRDGDLSVRRFRASAVEGDIDASFHAVASGNRIAANGSVQGAGLQFGKLEPTADAPAYPKQNVRLVFDTKGATARQLAANLNGHAEITGGAGRIANSTRFLFGDFFSELIATVNPFVKKEPYTAIVCSAFYADIVDGLITIKPGAVAQTDKLNMFADGQLNLKNEKLSLRINTTARTGLGVSIADLVNPFVGVGGTLAKPGLGLNRDKFAMLEGGVAYATGGASLVAKGLFNRWFGEKDPCSKLALEAQKRSASQPTMR